MSDVAFTCGLCQLHVDNDDYYRLLDCSCICNLGNAVHEVCIIRYLRKHGRSPQQQTGYKCPMTLGNGKPCRGHITKTHERLPINETKKLHNKLAAMAANTPAPAPTTARPAGKVDAVVAKPLAAVAPFTSGTGVRSKSKGVQSPGVAAACAAMMRTAATRSATLTAGGGGLAGRPLVSPRIIAAAAVPVAPSPPPPPRLAGQQSPGEFSSRHAAAQTATPTQTSAPAVPTLADFFGIFLASNTSAGISNTNASTDPHMNAWVKRPNLLSGASNGTSSRSPTAPVVAPLLAAWGHAGNRLPSLAPSDALSDGGSGAASPLARSTALTNLLLSAESSNGNFGSFGNDGGSSSSSSSSSGGEHNHCSDLPRLTFADAFAAMSRPSPFPTTDSEHALSPPGPLAWGSSLLAAHSACPGDDASLDPIVAADPLYQTPEGAFLVREAVTGEFRPAEEVYGTGYQVVAVTEGGEAATWYGVALRRSWALQPPARKLAGAGVFGQGGDQEEEKEEEKEEEEGADLADLLALCGCGSVALLHGQPVAAF